MLDIQQSSNIATNSIAISGSESAQQPQSTTQSQILSIALEDIVTQKSAQFKQPAPERAFYETSLIYCDLCEFSCEQACKLDIIAHYLAKHANENIIYNYLWSQLESSESATTAPNAATESQKLKRKYYLIKAHLRVKFKEDEPQQPQQPQQSQQQQNIQIDADYNNTRVDDDEVELECRFTLNKIINTIIDMHQGGASTHSNANDDENVSKMSLKCLNNNNNNNNNNNHPNNANNSTSECNSNNENNSHVSHHVIDNIEEEQQVFEFNENDLFATGACQSATDGSHSSADKLLLFDENNALKSHNADTLIQYILKNTKAQLSQPQPTHPVEQPTQVPSQPVDEQCQQGENLFVFKCNLCEQCSTDDLSQLLEHYKQLHEVDLSVSDSSILLTAAIAAFQTGHTIEMTGAILNTLSTITNENGLTIINGEELAVHTTVQYKCTLCYEIFYEKAYIVQHLRDMHQFDVDVSYFEAIEMQQQDQLHQKLYEQEQEQLQLQAQVQQQQQQQHHQQQQQQAGEFKTSEGEQLMQLSEITNTTEHHLTNSSSNNNNNNNNNNMNMNQSVGVGSMPPPPAPPMHIDENIHHMGAQQQPQVMQQQQVAATTNAVGSALIGVGGGALKCDVCEHRENSYEAIKKHEKQHYAATTLRFSCSYCLFGAEKLKKMDDHLKKYHVGKERTAVDNNKAQLVRINDEAPVATPAANTVAALVGQTKASKNHIRNHHQQHQQHQHHQPTHQINQSQAIAQHQGQGQNHVTTPASILSEQQELIAQIQSNTSGIMPHLLAEITEITTLTLENNNQLLIDFNENDDLACVYCDFMINNLNFMRTHIKYKHKERKVLFRNKKNLKFYTIINDTQSLQLFDPARNSSAAKKEQTQLAHAHPQAPSATMALLNAPAALDHHITNTQPRDVDTENALKHFSNLNITLNCHYCWAQFQLNASRNPKENFSNKFMQHLSQHLNAAYLCGECSYPLKDAKQFSKHKEFYKHDETAAIAKTTRCEMIDNKIYKYFLHMRQRQLLAASGHPDAPGRYKCALCPKHTMEREDMLKHVLIVHLAFLAYKCEMCAYYAFDEKQIAHHHTHVHKLTPGETALTQKSKLIKTEEEISLALSKASQLIIALVPENEANICAIQAGAENATLCEASPKYKCCKCLSDHQQPVLYSYQDALEHIIKSHMSTQQPFSNTNLNNATNNQSQKHKDKKICFELELLEENLEKLKDKNLLHAGAQSKAANKVVNTLNSSPNNTTVVVVGGNKRKFSQMDESVVAAAAASVDEGDDVTGGCGDGWNCIAQTELHHAKKFYFKTSLVFKCRQCSRRFANYNADHWLECHERDVAQLVCVRCHAPNAASDSSACASFANLHELYVHVRQCHGASSVSNCFVCCSDVKIEALGEHLATEHSLNEFDAAFLNDVDVAFIHNLMANNLMSVYETIRLPTHPSSFIFCCNDEIDLSVDLLEKYAFELGNEIKKLTEIHQQQIADKCILSWLNIDQLLVRNFNFNSFMCAICACSKDKIIRMHVAANSLAPSAVTEDEKTLIVANHILMHFNEYCYRCIACKISWPDRTQLLKHTQECQNSQVVRTKTKYKLKANARFSLQFYLLTLLEYWNHEAERLAEMIRVKKTMGDATQIGELESPVKMMNCKIFMRDLFSNNKKMLLQESCRHNLNAVNVSDSVKIIFEDE